MDDSSMGCSGLLGSNYCSLDSRSFAASLTKTSDKNTQHLAVAQKVQIVPQWSSYGSGLSRLGFNLGLDLKFARCTHVQKQSKTYIDVTWLHHTMLWGRPLKLLKLSGFLCYCPGICAFQHAPKIFTLESCVLFTVAVCTGHETALELLAHLPRGPA